MRKFLFVLAFVCASSPAVSASQGRVQFLPDNAEAWQVRLKLIKDAKKSIVTQYFIIGKDTYGLSYLELLRRKAQQGLDVWLMIDYKGSFENFLEKGGWQTLQVLQNAGVHIGVYNSSVLSGSLLNPTASNHDKILVTDHRYLLTGGRNVFSSYTLGPKDLLHPFMDCDVLADSEPEALRMEAAFFDEFGPFSQGPEALEFPFTAPSLKEAEKELTFAFGTLLKPADPILFPDKTQHSIRVIDSHSRLGSKREFQNTLTELFRSATKEILIHSPYVIFTKKIKKLIREASARGVRVVLHTAGLKSTDFPISQKLFLAEWLELYREAPTLEVYLYEGSSRFHQKMFIFDSTRVIISSYNLDSISEKVNSEIGLLVDSQKFGKTVSDWSWELMRRESRRLDPESPDSSLPKGLMYYLYSIYRAFY